MEKFKLLDKKGLELPERMIKIKIKNGFLTPQPTLIYQLSVPPLARNISAGGEIHRPSQNEHADALILLIKAQRGDVLLQAHLGLVLARHSVPRPAGLRALAPSQNFQPPPRARRASGGREKEPAP